MKKILFFHNTVTDYRAPLFKLLSEKSTNNLYINMIFTNIKLNRKVYGNDIDNKILNLINYESIQGIKAYFRIIKLIKQKQVVGVLIPTMDSFYENILTLFILVISKLFRKKIFYFWEGWESKRKINRLIKKIKIFIRKYLTLIVANNTDIIFSGSSKTKEMFLSYGINESKIISIPNTSIMPFFEKSKIRKKYNIPNNRKIILYFGRIIKRKGLDILIRAYKELSEEVKNKTWLVIVGNGEFLTYCKALTDNLDIRNVTWIGYVHPNYRYEYFSQSDIFVLPSYTLNGENEAWGLTLNEAIQCGKVIISTTACASAYDLINSKNGFMVQENNVEELKNAIEDCFKNNLFESAKKEDEHLLKFYNYDTMANIFLDGFKKIL